MPDLQAPAGRAAVLLDVRARNLTLELLLKAGCRNEPQLGRADGGHRVARIASLDSSRETRDHDRLEIEHVGLQRDVHSALRRGHANLPSSEPDVPHHEPGLAFGAREGELTLIAAHGVNGGADNRDVGSGDRFAGRRVRDPAGDLALLRPRARRSNGHEQRERDKQRALYHGSSLPSAQGYQLCRTKIRRPLCCARFRRSARREKNRLGRHWCLCSCRRVAESARRIT